MVGRYMVFLRGAKGVLVGRSVHNQRIERFWRDVFQQVGQKYYHAFSEMERRGLLNIDSPTSLLSLHEYILPLLNGTLREFQLAWNNHGLRTQHYETPAQMAVTSSLSFPDAKGVGDIEAQRVAAVCLLQDELYHARIQPRGPVGIITSAEVLIRNFGHYMRL